VRGRNVQHSLMHLNLEGVDDFKSDLFLKLHSALADDVSAKRDLVRVRVSTTNQHRVSLSRNENNKE